MPFADDAPFVVGAPLMPSVVGGTPVDVCSEAMMYCVLWKRVIYCKYVGDRCSKQWIQIS